MSVDSKDRPARGRHVVVDAASIAVAGVVLAARSGVGWPQAVLVGMAVVFGMVVSDPGVVTSLRASTRESSTDDRVRGTHDTLRRGVTGGVVGVVVTSMLGESLGLGGVVVAVVVPAAALGVGRTISRWSSTANRSGWSQVWPGWSLGKRLIDIAVAVILLVLLLPFALFSWFTTPGHERLRWMESSGRFGRPFSLPAAAVPRPNRRQRLVVLWFALGMVVRGHMSLVGPRPAIRADGDLADTDAVPDDAAQLAARPGLTGFWMLGDGDGSQPSTPLVDLAVLLQAGRRAANPGVRGRHGMSAGGQQEWTVRSTDGDVRVLHVVESLAAGVATALESYVRLTPEFEHIIIGHRREGSQIGDGLDELCEVVDLPTGPLAARRAVRSQVQRVRPDIVHAHSSLAGVYVRTLRGIKPRQVVYSPHCYAFERQDVSRLTRAAFRVVERGLARRTGTVAAVGEHEARLATTLRRTARTVVVPHVPDLPEPDGTRATASVANRPLTVAALGRIQPQKGTDFLIQAARLTARETRWRWIGGGDPEDEALLREAGVDVIGWVPRPQALAELADADVYVHTAQWEGMPLTVLEAAGLGLPVVARRIAPLDRIGLPRLADTPDAMAAHLDALQDAAARQATAIEVQRLIAQYTRERQRDALLETYQVADPSHLDPPSTTVAELV